MGTGVSVGHLLCDRHWACHRERRAKEKGSNDVFTHSLVLAHLSEGTVLEHISVQGLLLFLFVLFLFLSALPV